MNFGGLGSLSTHDRNNQYCRFPRMRCICITQYERLDESQLELSSIPEDKDISNEKEEQLIFFNEDGSTQSVVVEKNLCANDLCQLLALKNRVAKSATFSIIEVWMEYGLERILEDHEDVLSAYRDMKSFSRYSEFKFVFRKELLKYEFFQKPQEFFPKDMVDFDSTTEDAKVNGNYTLQNLITQEGQSPTIISQVWVSELDSNHWDIAFLLLRDKKLYISFKIQLLLKFLRLGKSKEQLFGEEVSSGVRVLANLTEYTVYTTLNAKNQFRAPTEWGLCLRPSGGYLQEGCGGGGGNTASGGDGYDEGSGYGGGGGGGGGDSTTGLLCLACDSDRARACWLTAMRLAKYGKQLRENYRAFKNKQADSINPKDYNSYTVPNESVRSRVAMDFTGSVGRIVDDPKEAKAIAVAEGYSWKRRWRPSAGNGRHLQQPQPGNNGGGGAPLYPVVDTSGVHMSQPWFHTGMTREQAGTLVSRHGTVDGVFLVRDSRSNPGAFVLTYKCGVKVLHTQIMPVRDPVRESNVYSLDSGCTKFYDLLQLVEFYQLNAGCLPTRLTHYVVQSTPSPNNTAVIITQQQQLPSSPQLLQKPPLTATVNNSIVAHNHNHNNSHSYNSTTSGHLNYHHHCTVVNGGGGGGGGGGGNNNNNVAVTNGL